MDAREILSLSGYSDDEIASDYPVWLGLKDGIATADLVAFGRTAPHDMSTAAVAVGQRSIDSTYAIARAIAAPYFMVANDRIVDLWVAEPETPVRWREAVSAPDVPALRQWLRPAAALTAKVGLAQLPLLDFPVDLLAAARATSADRLAPLVTNALDAAADALSVQRPARPHLTTVARATAPLHGS